MASSSLDAAARYVMHYQGSLLLLLKAQKEAKAQQQDPFLPQYVNEHATAADAKTRFSVVVGYIDRDK